MKTFITQKEIVAMKLIKMTALALIMMLGSSLHNQTSAQNYNNRNDVSYQTFYDELSPYGRWIDYPDYGYVWVPDAGPDFRPYSTNGHWVYTDDYEWMWVSDYEWGWAPFHYGRWEEDNDYGWFWVPGYEWSPAWVAWRDGGDYYGWAPLRPGINISINFNIGSYSPPYNYWSFAPRRYITSPRIFDYCVDRRQNYSIINVTTIINFNNYSIGFGFRSGPRRYDAERYCGRINPVRFRDSYMPGRYSYRDNEISFYRPNVRHDDDRRFSPRQFDRYERNNDNREARNDNGFRRNNDNVNDRGNNRESNRSDNNGFRQPGNNNENRRLDRNGNNGQNNRTNDNRITRPSERSDRNNNQSNDNGNRRFERSDNNNENRNTPVRQQDVRNNDLPQRQPTQQMERRQEPQPRQFERREDNNGNRNTTVRQQDVRSNEQPQRQPTQQMERRQEPQSRQSERNNESNRQQNTNSGNNNSRRRF
jgi:hypothetical protein